MLRHGRLARSARALRLAWARPSAHLAPRASLGRMKRSRASRGSVRQEACGAHAARAGIAARGRPHLTPRSARRSDTLTSLRAPRVARALQTQPGQQWQRIRQEACAQPGRASRREAGPHLAPRSARRSDTLTSLRAPRVARALQTQPGRQWQRTAGSQRRTDAARAGIAARGGRPHLAPRSARRSDAPSAHHLAPRSARRSERTAPRALRWRAALAR